MNKLFILLLISGIIFSTFSVDAYGEIVCHNGKDKDVTGPKLQRHLDHDDPLGSCSDVVIVEVLVCHEGEDRWVTNLTVHLGHDDTEGACIVDTVDDVIIDTIEDTTEKVTKKSSCDDCTPPIFEQYELNYTYYDMLYLVSPPELDMTKSLSLNMTVFESRVNHIDVIQFSIVKQPIYYSVNDGFGLVEFHFGWDNEIDKIIKSDEINIISWSNKIIPCHNEDCMNLYVEFNYTNEDSLNRNVLNVNTFDVSNNVSNSYIVDGFEEK